MTVGFCPARRGAVIIIIIVVTALLPLQSRFAESPV
jgi:hypothetical protein